MNSNIFISSPYIKCPKCGKKTFSVLSIGDNQYSRRCKDCHYPQEKEANAVYPLPELNKRVIYIDQNAMSDMMKSLNPETEAYKQGRIDVFWRNLFLKLDRLCKLQLVVCPASATHTKESAISQFYQALKQIYELLSCGVRFKDFATIKSFQLHEHAKNWISGNPENGINLDVDSAVYGKINVWQERYYFSVNFNFEDDSIKEYKNRRNITYDRLKPIFNRWRILLF